MYPFGESNEQAKSQFRSAYPNTFNMIDNLVNLNFTNPLKIQIKLAMVKEN